MNWTFDELVTKLEENYAYADFRDNIANTYQANALAAHGSGDYEISLWWIIKSVGAFLDAFDSILSFGYWGSYYYIPPKLFNMAGEADNGEVTMAAILSAMLEANQEELMSFVGITDAYRQSIWNQPFNQAYYAALARGFATWE